MAEQQPNTPREIIAQVIKALPDAQLAQFRGYFRDRLAGQTQAPKPEDVDQDTATPDVKPKRRGVISRIFSREKPPMSDEEREERFIDKEDIDTKVATLSKLKEQATFLSSEELSQVPDYKLLRLMLDGYLTVNQVRNLATDDSIISSAAQSDQPPTSEEMLKFSIITLKNVYTLVGKHYPELTNPKAPRHVIGEQLRLRDPESVSNYPGLRELNSLILNLTIEAPVTIDENIKSLALFALQTYTFPPPRQHKEGFPQDRKQIAHPDVEGGLQLLRAVVDSYNVYESVTKDYHLSEIEDKLSTEGFANLAADEVEDLARADKLNINQIEYLATNSPALLVQIINSGALNLRQALDIRFTSQSLELLDQINEKFGHRRPSADILRKYFAELISSGADPQIADQIPQLILTTLLNGLHVYTNYADHSLTTHIPLAQINQRMEDLDPLSFPDPDNARDDQREFSRLSALTQQLFHLYQRLESGDFSMYESVALTTLYHDRRLTPLLQEDILEKVKSQAQTLNPQQLGGLINQAPYILARLLWDGDLTRRQAASLTTMERQLGGIVQFSTGLENRIRQESADQPVQQTFEEFLAREGRNLSRVQLSQMALHQLLRGYNDLFELQLNIDDSLYNEVSVEQAKYILQSPQANRRYDSEQHLEIARFLLHRYELEEAADELISETTNRERIPVDDAYEAFRG